MLSYHRTCGMLSLFVVQVVGVILRVINICDTVGRDALNILWSVKVLLEYEYSRRLFIVGGGIGYILGKTIEFNVTSEILKPIVSIVLFYTALRLFNRYEYIIIGDTGTCLYFVAVCAGREVISFRETGQLYYYSYQILQLESW